MAKVTALDVAKKAGVSVGTVSRIANNLDVHSPETVARVRAAMDDLGFVPQGLRPRDNKKLKQIALVFPDLTGSLIGMTTALGAGVAQGAAEFFEPRGCQLLVMQMRSTGRLPFCITDGQVSGVIVRYSHLLPEVVRQLNTLPCIWVFGLHRPASRIDLVTVNNYEFGLLACEQIKQAARPHVVLVKPAGQFSEEFDLRLSCCEMALKPHGFSIDTVEFPALPESIKKHPKGSTSVVLPGHDEDLVRMHEMLGEAGLEPGREVPIISAVTDHERIRLINPHIRCISIDPCALGRIAAQQLVWRFENRNEPARTTLSSPRLIQA